MNNLVLAGRTGHIALSARSAIIHLMGQMFLIGHDPGIMKTELSEMVSVLAEETHQ